MKKGFTITELLAVISIIAILSVAAISGYSAMTKNSKEKTLEQKIQSIELAAEKYAKDQNISHNTVISVNKLVVMGYLQPDSSTDDGFSVITNPVTAANMICNLIQLQVVKDEVKVKYMRDKVDCDISDLDEMDGNINISAFNFNNDANRSLVYDGSTNSFAWTKEDVILFVSSIYENDAYSIMYEYGGNVTEKVINKANKATSASSKSQAAEVEKHYNEFVIQDVGSLFNNKVNVSFNMKDGSVKSKVVKVRIDREKPSGYVITSNDISTNELSQRKVSLFYDDANGSGVDGFYYNTVKNTGSGANYINADFKDDDVAKFGTSKGYFYGGRGDYYIYFKDKVGNISDTPLVIHIDNFDPSELSCDVSIHKLNNVTAGKGLDVGNGWFKEKLTMKFDGLVAAGSNGYKWDFVRGADLDDPMKLREFVNDGLLPTKTMNETAEMDLTLFTGGVAGFSSKTKELKKCSETVGIDWTKPTITFEYEGNTTYEKHQPIQVTITDNLSGFDATEDGSNKVDVMYTWSSTNALPDKKYWRTAKLERSGTYQRIISGTIDDNTFDGAEMTGKYYFFIIGGVVHDRAGNYLDKATPGVLFWFDNTPPTCTNSGSNDDWTNGTRTLTGTCADAHSGCAKHEDSGKYSYDNAGNVSRLYDYEINSTKESPGTIYDKAGNYKVCKGDQTVRIDKTPPVCTITLSPAEPDGDNGWYKADSVTATANFKDDQSEIANSGVISKGISDDGSGKYNNKTSMKRTKNAKSITVTCYVKDKAGNENTGTKKFKKDDGSEAKKGGCAKTGGNSTWKNKGPVEVGIKLKTKAISGCVEGGSSADNSTSVLVDNLKHHTNCTFTEDVDIVDDSFIKKVTLGGVVFRTQSGVKISCSGYNYNIYLDKKPPKCTKSSGGSKTWTNGSRTLTGTCKDQSGASGCKGNSTKVYNYEINSNTEAANHVFDNAGNESGDCPANQKVKIDKTPPQCSAESKGNECTTGGVKIKVTCSDSGGSKLKSCGGGKKSPYTTRFTSTPVATDNAGNSTTCSGLTVSTQTQWAKSVTCDGHKTSCTLCDKTWSSWSSHDCYSSKQSDTTTKDWSCVMSGKEDNSLCDSSEAWDCQYRTKDVCTSCNAAPCSGFKNYGGWKNTKLTCSSSDFCNVKTRTLYKTTGTCSET